MRDVSLGLWPALGVAEQFLELNLRTYVRHGDERGVWFFSLDAASPWAVAGARAWFGLPYHLARMSCRVAHDEWVEYESSRTADPSARFRARYRPRSAVCSATPGTLEHFLTERYALYALDQSGALVRARVQHDPWPLQDAEADILEQGIAAASGFTVAGEALCHFARRIVVRATAPVTAELK